MNQNAEIMVVLKKEGFYNEKEKVIVDEREKTVHVTTMTKKVLHHLALEGAFGGGAMGILRLSVFVIPNWWFVAAGLGFTVASTAPALINFPVSVRSGSYFLFDDRQAFRPYAGMEWLWNVIRMFNWDGIWVESSDNFWGRVNSGFFFGLEYKLSGNLRVACEIDLFISSMTSSRSGEGSWLQLALILRLM